MLSTFQKKIAGLAVTCLSLCVILAFAILTVKLFGAFLAKFSLVVWPLVTAAILSIIIKPAIDFLHSRCRMPRAWAAVSAFAAMTLALSVALLVLLPRAAGEIVAFCQSVPDIVSRFAVYMGEHFPVLKAQLMDGAASVREMDLAQKAVDGIGSFGKASVQTLASVTGAAVGVTGVAVGVASAVAAFAVVPIYLFYMLISETSSVGKIEKNLSFMDSNVRGDIVFLVRQFFEIMGTFFRGQLLIALIMGLMLGTGFWLAGVKFGFLLGLFVGLINIVPYLGTIIGLSTVLPLAYFQVGGGIWLSAAALGIFCLVQVVEGYVLTPTIMGNRTGLHPMVIIFSVFFWGTALNGILGMIMAIPLSAFIVVIWTLIKDKYLPALFSGASAADGAENSGAFPDENKK